MSRVRNLSLLLIPLWLLVSADSIQAYTIYLKDGNVMQAAKPYEVQGDRALITLLNESQTTIPLAAIDVERTREGNDGVTSGVSLGTKRVVTDQRTRTPRRDLSDLLRERQGREIERRSEPEPEPGVRVRKTAAGYNDLRKHVRVPFSSPEVVRELTELLQDEKLGSLQIYQGTQPERIFVFMGAETQIAVFRNLKNSAQALVDLRASYPEIEALEVFMATGHGSRAAQFLLTPEGASRLVDGHMGAAEFFIRYVEF